MVLRMTAILDRFGPFGGDTGDSFQWAPVGENLRLLAFSGYA